MTEMLCLMIKYLKNCAKCKLYFLDTLHRFLLNAFSQAYICKDIPTKEYLHKVLTNSLNSFLCSFKVVFKLTVLYLSLHVTLIWKIQRIKGSSSVTDITTKSCLLQLRPEVHIYGYECQWHKYHAQSTYFDRAEVRTCLKL